MPIIRIGGPKQEEVMKDTWGHLAPVAGRLYPGFIIFGHTALRESVLLEYDFEDLPGNPWTYDHVGAYHQALLDHPKRRDWPYEIRLWRWEGVYKVFKNERPKFTGKVRPLRLIDRFTSRRH